MRAAVLYEVGGPDKLVLEKVEEPTAGPREVLVNVKACGVDWHDVVIRNGTMRRGVHFHDVIYKDKSRPTGRGLILGHEIAGEVVETGAGVTTVKVNDRVVCKAIRSCGLCKYCRSGEETNCVHSAMNDGGYAEYVVLPEESAVQIPQEIDFEKGAILSCAIAVPFHAVRDVGRVTLGETVLVTGAGGGLGIHCVQIAKLCGARVIGLEIDERKAAIVREYGADEVICNQDPATPFWKQVLQLTEGEGADVVVDNVGTAVFADAFRSLA